ncbi:mucin-2-like [Watersipora subatra]|uniref:mucin-2-like n=1 Tax=Watersipora subatra TaxID=2589382 RepID=UPI00355BBBE3
MEKNVMAMALAKETQEKQDLSNRLLAKECEFNKLMSAVQNLKSRWASVATPLTPVATPPSVQQATIKPTSYSTPMKQVPAGLPSTPTVGRSPASLDSTTPLKSMPISDNVTPKSESSITVHSAFNTPRTPNSSFLLDNPKGILRNLGSASKSNRVVFSTPIEQKSLIVAPSESDTSVLDIEVVNKSLQAKSPETQLVNLSKTSNLSHSSKRSPLTHTKPTANALNNCNQSQANDPVSPALSSQSGERLPRSKMLKSGTGRKRLRPPGRREELGLITKAMKKHRFLMEHPATTGKKAIRESDSDCFGFGSE